MDQRICISCGAKIRKSAHEDPYICRECEVAAAEERYAYLDHA